MAEKITGYTSEMCQQAMIDELKELFRDMKFTGQEGEKPLKIFKQFIPSRPMMTTMWIPIDPTSRASSYQERVARW